MTIATSMMRSGSGLSPVISRSIQMRRLASCAIILSSDGPRRDHGASIRVTVDYRGYDFEPPAHSEARIASQVIDYTDMNTFTVALPAGAGDRHRHAPVAGKPPRRHIRGASRRGAGRVSPRDHARSAPEGRRLQQRQNALRHVPHRRRRRDPAAAHVRRAAADARRLGRAAGSTARSCAGPRSSPCSWSFARSSTCRSAVPHVQHRSALRLQQDDARHVPRRSAQDSGGRRGARPAAGAGRALADGQDGRTVVAVCVAGLGRVQPVHAGRLPDVHRAAVQQVLADAGRLAEAAHRGAADQMRLSLERPVRDGRLQPQHPRQCLLHRLRQDQAHRVLRHADLAARTRTRSKRCWRTNSGISSCITSCGAWPGPSR